MSFRSVFIIILKVLGIFFVQDILMSVTQLFRSFALILNEETSASGWFSFLSTSLLLSVYFYIAYLLILKTDMVVRKLQLDKHLPENQIEFNIHRSTVLRVSVIIVGGITLVNAFPAFVRQVYLYFQERNLTRGMTDPDPSFMVMYAFQLIIGFLLVYNSTPIVNFIEFRRRKNG